MKVLIFSDTHLTSCFEKKKFQYLQRIISSADRVIINGDLWDGFLISFQDFYQSEWKKLFPLLKQKDTIYLFGNHDEQHLNNLKLLGEFSQKTAQTYSFQDSGIQYIIEHGHRIFPTELGCENVESKIFRSKVMLWGMAEKLLACIFGQSYQILLKKNNTILKKSYTYTSPEKIFHIFGHTHCSEVDSQKNFINTGIIRHGLGQYMMIENGKVSIVNERYN